MFVHKFSYWKSIPLLPLGGKAPAPLSPPQCLPAGRTGWWSLTHHRARSLGGPGYLETVAVILMVGAAFGQRGMHAPRTRGFCFLVVLRVGNSHGERSPMGDRRARTRILLALLSHLRHRPGTHWGVGNYLLNEWMKQKDQRCSRHNVITQGNKSPSFPAQPMKQKEHDVHWKL